jgi:hypothetical protein
MYIKRNVQARSPNHFCRGKAVLNVECVRILALVYDMQIASFMRRIGYLWSIPFYYIFSILSHKLQDFRKEKIENKKVYFEFLYNFCPKHFSLW